jgi:hypothetical protein
MIGDRLGLLDGEVLGAAIHVMEDLLGLLDRELFGEVVGDELGLMVGEVEGVCKKVLY